MGLFTPHLWLPFNAFPKQYVLRRNHTMAFTNHGYPLYKKEKMYTMRYFFIYLFLQKVAISRLIAHKRVPLQLLTMAVTDAKYRHVSPIGSHCTERTCLISFYIKRLVLHHKHIVNSPLDVEIPTR